MGSELNDWAYVAVVLVGSFLAGLVADLVTSRTLGHDAGPGRRARVSVAKALRGQLEVWAVLLGIAVFKPFEFLAPQTLLWVNRAVVVHHGALGDDLPRPARRLAHPGVPRAGERLRAERHDLRQPRAARDLGRWPHVHARRPRRADRAADGVARRRGHRGVARPAGHARELLRRAAGHAVASDPAGPVHPALHRCRKASSPT